MAGKWTRGRSRRTTTSASPSRASNSTASLFLCDPEIETRLDHPKSTVSAPHQLVGEVRHHSFSAAVVTKDSQGFPIIQGVTRIEWFDGRDLAV